MLRRPFFWWQHSGCWSCSDPSFRCWKISCLVGPSWWKAVANTELRGALLLNNAHGCVTFAARGSGVGLVEADRFASKSALTNPFLWLLDMPEQFKPFVVNCGKCLLLLASSARPFSQFFKIFSQPEPGGPSHFRPSSPDSTAHSGKARSTPSLQKQRLSCRPRTFRSHLVWSVTCL